MTANNLDIIEKITSLNQADQSLPKDILIVDDPWKTCGYYQRC